MGEETDNRFPCSALGAEGPSGEHESLAREFIASGIDDLVKHRIVQLLYEHQSLTGDADLFAACLGFHSVELTATRLDELATSGILEADRARGRRPRYRLSDDGKMRRRLTRLYNAPVRPQVREDVLQVLVRRSLEKTLTHARDVAWRARAPEEAALDQGADGDAKRRVSDCSAAEAE